MTDYRFDHIVTDVTVERGSAPWPGADRVPVACRALCSDCGTYHTAELDEMGALAGQPELEYVASMRAWNCCHEGQVPHDGFPEEPEYYRIDGPDSTC